MLHITDSFTAHTKATKDAPAREIKVFITDIIMDYKDKAVLKHLTNSNVDITQLPDIDAAYKLAEELDAQKKLVTSQKDVNIRYNKWHLAQASDSVSESKPCEDPSIGPDHVYNKALVKAISENVIAWCKTRRFKSFISFDMLDKCIINAIYGDVTTLDDHQLAVIDFAREKFTKRYCVLSPFNNKGYNIGSELMCMMYPDGVRYRKEKYVKNFAQSKKTYFIILKDRVINPATGEETMIPEGTFLERSELRTNIDTKLYYSTQA